MLDSQTPKETIEQTTKVSVIRLVWITQLAQVDRAGGELIWKTLAELVCADSLFLFQDKFVSLLPIRSPQPLLWRVPSPLALALALALVIWSTLYRVVQLFLSATASTHSQLEEEYQIPAAVTKVNYIGTEIPIHSFQ